MHETHLQYNKLPKYTPAELSRMKADKDVRDVQEQGALFRARQEDRNRQLLEQRQRLGLGPAPVSALNETCQGRLT